MGILLMVHSIVRWLVVGAALIALVIFALTWLRRQQTNSDRRMMVIFLSLLDTQVLLGLVLILWMGLSSGQWPMYRIEHAVTMLLALAIAHVSARWKTAASVVRARNYLFVVLGTFVLIAAGVSRLPQGWLG